MDELKSRRFWWIFHGDTVYALESLIDDRKDELSGESSAHDEALREMLDLFPRVWPYQAVRRDGELLLKFNKKGTRVRVKGTLAIEARDGSSEAIPGKYQIDARGPI